MRRSKDLSIPKNMVFNLKTTEISENNSKLAHGYIFGDAG